MNKLKRTSAFILCAVCVFSMLAATFSVGAAGYDFPEGATPVAVTLDGSYRAIYAQNLADGSSSKREYFLMGSGSSEKALLLGYSPPEILGVAIVCDGGSSEGVKSEIISMVSALLHLPTNKIYVAASNN